MWIQEQFEAIVTLDGVDYEKWKKRRRKNAHTKYLKINFRIFLTQDAPRSSGAPQKRIRNRNDIKIRVKLTVNRSGQHGIAANMSYAYIVPRTNDDPFHFCEQNLIEK